MIVALCVIMLDRATCKIDNSFGGCMAVTNARPIEMSHCAGPGSVKQQTPHNTAPHTIIGSTTRIGESLRLMSCCIHARPASLTQACMPVPIQET